MTDGNRLLGLGVALAAQLFALGCKPADKPRDPAPPPRFASAAKQPAINVGPSSRPHASKPSGSPPLPERIDPLPCADVAACQRRCARCASKSKTAGCDATAATDCKALARRHTLGRGLPFDMRKAANLFGRACEHGDLEACAALGLQVQDGLGIAADLRAAMALYQRACRGGRGVGCFNLALIYRSGNAGVAVDEAKAEQLFRQAVQHYQASCEKGELAWCMNLGVMYEDGWGVNKDLAKAARIWRAACMGGNGDACVNLALLLERGKSTPNAGKWAAQLLQATCKHDHALACNALGMLHWRAGAGLKKDPAAAAKLLTRACELGYRHACTTLGALLMLGQGQRRDPQRALTLFSRACAAGDPQGCSYSGTERLRSKDVREQQRALIDLKTACRIGDGAACANVGALYGQGRIVKGDKELELRYYRRACLQAQPGACVVLHERGQPIPLAGKRRQRFLSAACKRGFRWACTLK